MKFIQIINQKRFTLITIFLFLYVLLNLLDGERCLISYYEKQSIKENLIEVNTILRLSPNQEVKHKMLTEINLTSLVSVDKNYGDKKDLEKVILVKVPEEVYPG